VEKVISKNNLFMAILCRDPELILGFYRSSPFFMAISSISDTKIYSFQYYATHNTIFFIVVGGG
jgi:hypothetical protein